MKAKMASVSLLRTDGDSQCTPPWHTFDIDERTQARTQPG